MASPGAVVSIDRVRLVAKRCRYRRRPWTGARQALAAERLHPDNGADPVPLDKLLRTPGGPGCGGGLVDEALSAEGEPQPVAAISSRTASEPVSEICVRSPDPLKSIIVLRLAACGRCGARADD